jgi:glycosyltransferase involved in cell wall biosynthesis
MRILLNAVAAKMGGGANYIRTLARELADQHQHEFLFLVPETQAAAIRDIAPHIRVITSNIGDQPFLRRLWFDQVGLPRILRRERIDVLFSTANFATFFCPCRQLLLVRNSLYFSSLYRSQILPHKSWRVRAGEALRRWLAGHSAMAADVVLTPSQAMLDELRTAVDVQESVVNHYGVDRQRFHPAPKTFAADGYVSLVFTSLYSEHKNLGTLFRALLELEALGQKCRLITTADPDWEKIDNPIRESDRQLADELKRRALVEFTGVLAGPALDQLYARGDIFVYPSVVESFGHPLLEAMAAGLPIVAADVPINRELCGDAAIYFAPFDHIECARAIDKVIADAELRDRLVQDGMKNVEKFAWAKHVNQLVQACSMTDEAPIVNVTAYVLAKNEEPNISNCLRALKKCGLFSIVLDSGSTDRTRELAIGCDAKVEDYQYRDHLEALRYICEERTPVDEFALILDADMVVSPELVMEAKSLLNNRTADVAAAPVTMYWNGRRLNRGSLYPAKPFMFRGGAHYFEAAGHGEVLVPGTRTAITEHDLIHNDLKSFEAYLVSQLRYSNNLVRRRSVGKLTWRDRLRMTPLMLLAVPLFSYVFKGGIFSGTAGLGYAMDRLIAEAMMYRQHIAYGNQSRKGNLPETLANSCAPHAERVPTNAAKTVST